MTSLPNAKWDGTSADRDASELQFKESPTGDDYSRLLQEFFQLQDLALLRSTNALPSSPITNLSVETDFDLTATLPAALLKAGDVIHVTVRGICPTTHLTDTLAIKLYFGSVLIATIAAEDAVNNEEFIINAELFVIDTGHFQAFVRQSDLAAPAAWVLTEKGVASSDLDLTAAVTIKASATWSVASTSNTVKLSQLNVDLKRGV